mgnify:CR=1 FL=1
MNLKGRDFLTLLDYTPEEIAYLVDLAAELFCTMYCAAKTLR